MKLVVAIIKPYKLNDVWDALMPVGVQGITVTDVMGGGIAKLQPEIYAGGDYAVDFLPKVKIELAVNDEDVDAVVTAFRSTAHTGRLGDGRIFVLDLCQAVRIRTGERDSEAF